MECARCVRVFVHNVHAPVDWASFMSIAQVFYLDGWTSPFVG